MIVVLTKLKYYCITTIVLLFITSITIITVVYYMSKLNVVRYSVVQCRIRYTTPSEGKNHSGREVWVKVGRVEGIVGMTRL